MKIKTFKLIPLICWAIVIVCSMVWNLRLADNSKRQIVQNIGRSFFKEIETTRLWNAKHGGVYVPITEKTKPNPYLISPHRDVTTSKGLQLTLVNPAFMTRQIAELAKYENKIQYHITSLKPIRPENKADEWERKALNTFENNRKELFEFMPKTKTYKYMASLPVKEAFVEIKESNEIFRGNERILFIDDEESLTEVGKEMLECFGYHVTVQNNSLEALKIFRNNPGEFDLVITDQTMPNMTGADLSKHIRQVRSDIPIILCSGYSKTIDEKSAKELKINEFVLKPFTKDVFIKLIRKVLDA